MPTFSTPSPLPRLHTSDVDDAHVAVRQWLNPIIESGVALSPPRLSPVNVTLQPAVDAPFISLA